MRSLSTLSTAQVARNFSLPSQVIAPAPAREIGLEGLRQRNAVLDYFFYDLGAVTPEEASGLALRYAREGSILRVGPTGSGLLESWADTDEFARSGAAAIPPAAIAVAGVGSSALGAAAFARNVADALGTPVLAVVSGYGLSDLMTEAVGGFFLFGQLNSVRHVFEWLDDVTRPARPSEQTLIGTTGGNMLGAARRSLDVKTLVALITKFEPGLLIGHSKGNLVVSEALFELRDENADRIARLAEVTRIITVSARITMPRQFGEVIDIMGALDGFGEFNSRRRIPTDIEVPLAWHHTNTDLPFHLPVTKTLKQALATQA